jgi:ElaB/YqjD/DUF883 family membrane-anchored ribosome-binding protein
MFTNKSSKHSHNLADAAAPLLNSASEEASDLAQRVVEAVRESSQELQNKATRASDITVKYIRNEPVKSLLIAAATGATLMALVSLMLRSRNRD